MLVRYYGHVGGASGYGQAANETCMAMLEAGIDLEISTDGKQLRHPHLPLSSHIRNEADLTPDPDAVIVHTLPLDCAKIMHHLGEVALRTPRRVAYTTWEGVSPISDEVDCALSSYLEVGKRPAFTDIWVPSTVTAAKIQECHGSPRVHVVPHAYYVAMGGRADRACRGCGDFHVVDDFHPGAQVVTPDGPGTVFEWSQYGGNDLYVRVQFDGGHRENYAPCQLEHPERTGPYRFYYIGAWAIRKNVEGVIQAYMRSFSPRDNVEFVIQSSGAADSACDVARIATGLPLNQMAPVRYSNQRLSDDRIRALHRECHCFVTATRGEAWNLPAFDAMIAGRHIIAPREMGSDDFLFQTSADLYGGTRAPASGEVVIAADPMAPPGHLAATYVGTQGLTVRSDWIEPDIAMLAKLMRQAYVENKTRLRVNYDPAARFGRQAVGARIKTLLEGEPK